MIDACGDSPLGLWTLIAANVGAYGSDLGEARLTELDLETGTLTRRRTKTGGRGGPIGRWSLWDETLERLKASLIDRPAPREGVPDDLIFPNARGGPIWRFEAGGFKSDNARSALKRLRKRLGDEFKIPSFPDWRRTGATLLRSGPFADVRGVWLAQAPKSAADRSYAAAPLSRAVRACGWLGEQYGFPTDPARLESAAVGTASPGTE